MTSVKIKLLADKIEKLIVQDIETSDTVSEIISSLVSYGFLSDEILNSLTEELKDRNDEELKRFLS